jgi:hypothetical protein
MSLEIGSDFLSRRRAEVFDFVHPVESGAPSPSEFGDTLRQPLDFAIVVRWSVDIDEHDLAEWRRLEIERQR